jgi:hypothetical protein
MVFYDDYLMLRRTKVALADLELNAIVVIVNCTSTTAERRSCVVWL